MVITFYSRANNIPDTNPAQFAPAQKNFDDSMWLIVDIPNDFVVNGTVQQHGTSGNHGFLPRNISWFVHGMQM